MIFVDHYTIQPPILETVFVKHCRVEIMACPFVLFHRNYFFNLHCLFRQWFSSAYLLKLFLLPQCVHATIFIRCDKPELTRWCLCGLHAGIQMSPDEMVGSRDGCLHSIAEGTVHVPIRLFWQIFSARRRCPLSCIRTCRPKTVFKLICIAQTYFSTSKFTSRRDWVALPGVCHAHSGWRATFFETKIKLDLTGVVYKSWAFFPFCHIWGPHSTRSFTHTTGRRHPITTWGFWKNSVWNEDNATNATSVPIGYGYHWNSRRTARGNAPLSSGTSTHAWIRTPNQGSSGCGYYSRKCQFVSISHFVCNKKGWEVALVCRLSPS